MSLKHILLGLINEVSQSGYDLHKAFENIFHTSWTADQRQIYHALNEMHKQGWIVSELIIQENSPNKKLYQLTEAGQAELQRWLKEPLPLPPYKLDWIAQLLFGYNVATEDLLPVLRNRYDLLYAELQEMEQLLEIFSEFAKTPLALERWRRLTLRVLAVHYGQTHLNYELDWLRQAIDTLEQLAAAEEGDLSIVARLLEEMQSMGKRDGERSQPHDG